MLGGKDGMIAGDSELYITIPDSAHLCLTHSVLFKMHELPFKIFPMGS